MKFFRQPSDRQILLAGQSLEGLGLLLVILLLSLGRYGLGWAGLSGGTWVLGGVLLWALLRLLLGGWWWKWGMKHATDPRKIWWKALQWQLIRFNPERQYPPHIDSVPPIPAKWESYESARVGRPFFILGIGGFLLFYLILVSTPFTGFFNGVAALVFLIAVGALAWGAYKLWRPQLLLKMDAGGLVDFGGEGMSIPWTRFRDYRVEVQSGRWKDEISLRLKWEDEQGQIKIYRVDLTELKLDIALLERILEAAKAWQKSQV
ncbi:MAG: hypothetical protein AAFR61_02110 [Bacteroidota bacterium]